MGDLSAHFSRHEFACHCGCGFDTPSRDLVRALEAIRRAADQPIRVLSGCRCPEHNRRVGGAVRSQHLFGHAADIQIHGLSPRAVADLAHQALAGNGGIGVYNTFTHVDVRPGGPVRWRG